MLAGGQTPSGCGLTRCSPGKRPRAGLAPRRRARRVRHFHVQEGRQEEARKVQVVKVPRKGALVRRRLSVFTVHAGLGAGRARDAASGAC